MINVWVSRTKDHLPSRGDTVQLHHRLEGDRVDVLVGEVVSTATIRLAIENETTIRTAVDMDNDG